MTGGAAAQAEALLAAWWAAVRQDPSRLPAGVEPVQARLIRSVGRAELPGHGRVYLKQMGFPRWQDRLRYLLRALPARHEARMLRCAAAHGIPVPRVLFAAGRRRFGQPCASLLVTQGLDVDGEPQDGDVACLAARLADAGIWHRDLHRGNFVRCQDGRTVVLDLQSARSRRKPLGRRLRVRMAAKLVASGVDPAQLTASGLLAGTDAAQARALAERQQRHWLRRRIERCLQCSTEFDRRRWQGGILFSRRGQQPEGIELVGGPELERLWLGDRALEVLEGRKPMLVAWFRKSRWLRGPGSVYIPRSGAQPDLVSVKQELERGYVRYLTLRSDS